MAALRPVQTARRKLRLADGTVVWADANSAPASNGGVAALPEPGKTANRLSTPANDPTQPVAALPGTSAESGGKNASDIGGVLSTLRDFAASRSQPLPRPALPETEGNDFMDRANGIPVLGNIASGFKGALQAASQPNAKLGNILAYGALNTLFPNDMRASEQRQQMEQQYAADQARADKDREFGLNALKELVSGTNTADKNTADVAQNAETARHNLAAETNDAGVLNVRRGELGVSQRNADLRGREIDTSTQAKADAGFNQSLLRYQSVGKVFDKFGTLLDDPKQPQLPFEEVMTRAAYDNPMSTQGKRWAADRLDGIAAGRRAIKDKKALDAYDKQYGTEVQKIQATFFPNAQ